MENNQSKLDWSLKITIIFSILIVALSILFYLVIYPLLKIQDNGEQKEELQSN